MTPSPRRSPAAFLSIAVTVASAASAAVGVGCGTPDDDSPIGCGHLLAHSHVYPPGMGGVCKCDAGYTWEDPEDTSSGVCRPIVGKPDASACTGPHNVLVDASCRCEGGFNWCDEDDILDLSCCVDEAQDAISDTVTEGDGTDMADGGASGDTAGESGEVPDPAECSVATPDLVFCSGSVESGPAGSRYFTCTDGAWTENPAALQASCASDGFDFAYGCVAEGTTEDRAVRAFCGNGPGAPCDEDGEGECVDADAIDYCRWGKTTRDSCATICSTAGDDAGVVYASGVCVDRSPGVYCDCCDGDEQSCAV